MEYTIVTIPRTGSNYLDGLITQKIPYFPSIVRTHEFFENPGHIITLARDPKDAVLSRLAMRAAYAKQNLTPFPDKFQSFKFMVDYINMGERLYKEARIIIDYDDLINYPDKVIKYIAKDMQRPYKNIEYKNDLKDKEDKSYLVSSKNTTCYTELKPLVDSLDFTKAYKVYHKMLSRAIKVQTDGI
jgi:hypothetical protein